MTEYERGILDCLLWVFLFHIMYWYATNYFRKLREMRRITSTSQDENERTR